MTPEQQAILKIIEVLRHLNMRLARETGTNTAVWAADTLHEAWELIDTIPGRPISVGSVPFAMTDEEVEMAVELVRNGMPAKEAMTKVIDSDATLDR
jgi:hypothetical protein